MNGLKATSELRWLRKKMKPSRDCFDVKIFSKRITPLSLIFLNPQPKRVNYIQKCMY